MIKRFFRSINNNVNAKATIAYMLGNVFYKAFPLIMLPILTAMMSTEEYGIANTYLSWVSIISCINCFGLGNAIRAASIDYANDFDEYFSSVSFLSIIQYLIISVTGYIIVIIFFPNVPETLALLCSTQAFFSMIINAYIIKNMVRLNYKTKMALQILPNIIIGLLSVVFIGNMTDNKYLGRVYAFVIVNVVLGLILLLKAFAKGHTFYNRKYWEYGIKFSLPLVFSGLALVLLSSFDRTMLTSMVDASESGIYSVAYSVGTAVLILTSSFEAVWIPWFTKRIKETDFLSINNGFRMYINIGTALIMSAMLVLPDIFKIFANQAYWDGIKLIPPIVLANVFVFYYTFYVNYEYLEKKTKRIAVNTSIAAIINILLNYFFIPIFHANAAAYTTVIAYVFSFLLHKVYVKKLMPNLFPGIDYSLPLIYIVIGVGCCYLFINLWFIRWVIACIFVIVSAIWLRKYGNLFSENNG